MCELVFKKYMHTTCKLNVLFQGCYLMRSWLVFLISAR